MIGNRVDTSFCKRSGSVVHFGSRQAVHDAGIASVALGDEGLELRSGVLFLNDLVVNIRAIETRDEVGRTIKIQAGNDLPTGEFICRGRERDPRNIRKALREYRQPHVLWAKVVPPLRHAMRLVDGEQREPRAGEKV